MKTKLFLAITIIVFFISISDSLAQGNLQFNKVVYFKCNATVKDGSYFIKDTIITVPANKVLKIESCAGGSDINNIAVVRLNDVMIYMTKYTDNTFNRVNFPIWLPAGEHKFSVYCPDRVSFFISAIEFNIVQ